MTDQAILSGTDAIALRYLAPNARQCGNLVRFNIPTSDGKIGEPIAYSLRTNKWRAKSSNTKGHDLSTLWSYVKGVSIVCAETAIKALVASDEPDAYEKK